MIDMATLELESPPRERPAANGRRIRTIAHYVVTSVPTAEPDALVAEVRQLMVGRRYDEASRIFVVSEDDQLVGIADIADLIAAEASTPIRELMKSDRCPGIRPETDREEAASAAIRMGASSLAVCDADGRFVGAAPAAALMSILRDEHLEDLHHLVGILSRSEEAKEALTAPPHRRALYRLPWLLIGMAGSAATTTMMTRFETALAAHIAVAFFIPAIVYLADSVGTQSEVVAVRGMSLTDGDLLPLFAGELGTGTLLGAMLGCLAFPLVWFAFESIPLAATVAIALAVASSISTAVGFLLPWLFGRLGYDPALGSGPVATVIQNFMSLLTYFLIATALVF